MKVELDLDTQEFAKEIAQAVFNIIKPILTKNKTEDDKLFTVETLAEYLGVSKGWIYTRTHLREIPYIKIGRFPRFRKQEIDKWLNTLKSPCISRLNSYSSQ